MATRSINARTTFGTRILSGGIDASKVIIVYNSDEVDSETVADYYIEKRAIPTANKLGVPMGAYTDNTLGFSPSLYNDVLVPVANKIKSVGAHAVILSAFCPTKTQTGGATVTLSLSGLLATARHLVDTNGSWPKDTNSQPWHWEKSSSGFPWNSVWMEPILPWLPAHFVFNQDTGATAPDEELAHLMERHYYADEDYLGNRYWCLHGILGVGDFNYETVALAKRIIDDAVANEKSYAQAITEGADIHIGANDRSGAWINGYQAELARQLIDAKGLPYQWYEGDYGASYPSQPTEDYAIEDMMGTATTGACFAGTGNLSPAEDLWGHIDQAICNADAVAASAPNTWPESYNILPGAWGVYITSTGIKSVVSLLNNGGCAGVSTVHEPLADGVADMSAFMREILAGKTMAEANVFGGGVLCFKDTVVGDPLYAPFGKQFRKYV